MIIQTTDDGKDIIRLASGGLRILRMSREDREFARGRRRILADAKICINGVSHGKATHGILCYRCRLVHRGMAPADALVAATAAGWPAPLPVAEAGS